MGASEDQLRSLHDAGDLAAVAEGALESYGPEILGFLVASMGDRAAADEAFSVFCEDLWRGLPAFAWRATLRTWAYRLARNAATRVGGSAWVRRGRGLRTHELSALEARVRESTAAHLRSTMKGEIAALRAGLTEDERQLLILRVDRALPWDDVALILLGEGGRAATVRKRFERLTDKLRKRAKAAGLLG